MQAFPWICCKTHAFKWWPKLSAALPNLGISLIQQALNSNKLKGEKLAKKFLISDVLSKKWEILFTPSSSSLFNAKKSSREIPGCQNFYLKNFTRSSSGLNSFSPAGAVGFPNGICAISCQLSRSFHSFLISTPMSGL